MKITHVISETTTSGSVATVATPLFKQSRKGGNLLTGKKTNKKYANSISEGKMKELAMDLKSGKDGLTDVEFKNKYGKTKDEMRKSLEKKPENSKKVDEAKLDEEDVIIVPGQGRKFKTGFIPHGKDRTDHEVEMALSDLFQAAKNAKQVYEIVKTYSEEDGLEGWVQEKIIKANDYLNTIREYLEHRQITREGTLGSLAGGIAGAVIGKTPSAIMTGAELGSTIQDKLSNESGAGVIAGGLQYEDNDVQPGPWTTANDIMKKIFDIAKSNKKGEITIRNVSATVSPEKAKALVDVYKMFKQAGKDHEFLHIFVDTKKFTKLLRSNFFNELVSKHSNDTDIIKQAQARAFKDVEQKTSKNNLSAKPRVDVKV